MCPSDATLATNIEKVKGSKGVGFIESKGRGEDNMGFRIVGVCPKRTTHQVCS
jgi:hypothetical protein